jgi:tripartite-type tricarboxylate transporter receptor subunit TctC
MFRNQISFITTIQIKFLDVLKITGLAWLSCFFSVGIFAQQMTIIVPSPAGGTLDILARSLAQQSSGWVVNNIAGAGGEVARQRITSEPPESTLLISSNYFGSVVSTSGLRPIALIAQDALGLWAHPDNISAGKSPNQIAITTAADSANVAFRDFVEPLTKRLSATPLPYASVRAAAISSREHNTYVLLPASNVQLAIDAGLQLVAISAPLHRAVSGQAQQLPTWYQKFGYSGQTNIQYTVYAHPNMSKNTADQLIQQIASMASAAQFGDQINQIGLASRLGQASTLTAASPLPASSVAPPSAGGGAYSSQPAQNTVPQNTPAETRVANSAPQEDCARLLIPLNVPVQVRMQQFDACVIRNKTRAGEKVDPNQRTALTEMTSAFLGMGGDTSGNCVGKSDCVFEMPLVNITQCISVDFGSSRVGYIEPKVTNRCNYDVYAYLYYGNPRGDSSTPRTSFMREIKANSIAKGDSSGPAWMIHNSVMDAIRGQQPTYAFACHGIQHVSRTTGFKMNNGTMGTPIKPKDDRSYSSGAKCVYKTDYGPAGAAK